MVVTLVKCIQNFPFLYHLFMNRWSSVWEIYKKRDVARSQIENFHEKLTSKSQKVNEEIPFSHCCKCLCCEEICRWWLKKVSSPITNANEICHLGIISSTNTQNFFISTYKLENYFQSLRNDVCLRLDWFVKWVASFLLPMNFHILSC